MSNPSQLKGVIFDLDGVLTDTAEFHYQAWQQLAEERKRSDERIEALINQASEERRQASEERQAMMATIAELTNAIAELQRRNGAGAANGE